jgi:hypothetical protein
LADTSIAEQPVIVESLPTERFRPLGNAVRIEDATLRGNGAQIIAEMERVAREWRSIEDKHSEQVPLPPGCYGNKLAVRRQLAAALLRGCDVAPGGVLAVVVFSHVPRLEDVARSTWILEGRETIQLGHGPHPKPEPAGLQPTETDPKPEPPVGSRPADEVITALSTLAARVSVLERWMRRSPRREVVVIGMLLTALLTAIIWIVWRLPC